MLQTGVVAPTIAVMKMIVGYYAAFWLPAALLGIVAGMLAVRRS